jgi:hypothetical protein
MVSSPCGITVVSKSHSLQSQLFDMAVETPVDPFLQGHTGRNTRGLLRLTILCLIAAAAVASRLFSVISKSTLSCTVEYFDAFPIAL